MVKDYLYNSFRLVRVNTAQDLKRTANPLVSLAVMVGGLAIAITLFMTHRAVVVAENLAQESYLYAETTE